ncbi:MAG: hypothetical protein I8H67_12755 [Comamonadaceae bacterium]|nr:hypothetical protein [Comamonadaceae bacterium]
MGTWMLSIPDGHCRCAHVGALRGDGVAPDILGMQKIMGDDSLRRALIHTDWIGNLRLVLDAQLEPGNRHSPPPAWAGLLALLEGMPQEQRPKRVRGDCALGSEGDLCALEAMGQPCLFKRRQSAGGEETGAAPMGAARLARPLARAGMRATTRCA